MKNIFLYGLILAIVTPTNSSAAFSTNRRSLFKTSTASVFFNLFRPPVVPINPTHIVIPPEDLFRTAFQSRTTIQEN